MADLPTLKPATDNPMPDAEPTQSRQPKVKSGVRTSSACLACRKRRTKVSIGNHIHQYSSQPDIAYPTSLSVHWNWAAMRVMRQTWDGVHIQCGKRSETQGCRKAYTRRYAILSPNLERHDSVLPFSPS